MRIESDEKLDFSDVLIKPKRSTLQSRSEVDLTRTYTFVNSRLKFKGIPIIAANMDTVGTIAMARELGKHQIGTALHKHYESLVTLGFYNKNSDIRDNVFYSMGITKADLEKYHSLTIRMRKECKPKNICIDVANGYSEPFLNFVKQFRDDNPEITIMAGNVVTAEMTEALILGGADIVKVGIGPGSVCTTRKQTGVGYPQLSAVIECADAAHGLGGHICSDGGCTVPGDVAKAFGAGADFVMLGGMLAGHDESGGEIVERCKTAYEGPGAPKEKVVKFYGMSSSEAMEKHSGGVAEYRASEGKSVMIPYRGPVENTVKEILGGLRSACTYTGARKLKELSKRTTFIKVSGKQQKNNVYGEE